MARERKAAVGNARTSLGGPPRLQRGDRVHVVATGFAVRPEALDRGLRVLERMGFDVQLGKHVLDRSGYLAGDDSKRAEDLERALADRDASAVWFARGGYGTARILDRVAWTRLRRFPKLLIGYSDLTALFAPAVSRGGARCLYGPVVTELGDPLAWHRPSLRALLAGRALRRKIPKSHIVAPGQAQGTLVGGNLTVLTHLCGTRWAPDLRDAVLFLEEVGEESYRIDRALTQLRTAGALKGLRAVLIGAFRVPGRRRFPPDRPWLASIRETFLPLGIPVVTGVPAGHVPGKWTLPLGGRAEVDTAARELRLTP